MLSYAEADRLQTGMGGVFGKLRGTVSGYHVCQEQRVPSSFVIISATIRSIFFALSNI